MHYVNHGDALRKLALATTLGMSGIGVAYAQEVTSSVQNASTDISAQMQEKEHRDDEPNRQDGLDAIVVEPSLPGFREGMQVTFKPRTYYLNRDRDKKQDVEGWALGGAVEGRTGWLGQRVQLSATVYTSQILYGPEEKDGTQLFKPGPHQITTLGEAYMTVRLGKDSGLRIGRQSFDLPWLARHDIRMVPNTFEAIAVGRKATTGFTYLAGYVNRIKRKNDDSFIPMSEAAGAIGTNEGLGLLAAQYTFKDDSLIGATNQTSFDVMNTFFIKGEKSFRINDDVSLRAYGQYTDQRSTGKALIGDFHTWLASIKGEIFFPNASIRLATSRAGEERGLQSPFGGPPNYLSIIVDNFDRAGEKAVMIGASYDFAGAGIKGLSVFSNISRGNTPDAGPNASPDETEYDLTVDYRFGKDSALNGLWLRARGAWIDQDEKIANGDDFFDFRIIANYTFNLF